MNSVRTGVLSAFAGAVIAIAATSAAQAGIVFDTDLAAPGVYFGSGNGGSPQHFAVNTEGGVEIALRSKVPFVGPPAPIGGNTYLIPLGSVFSFDFSVNPNVGVPMVDLSHVVASLTLTNLGNGATFSFDPSLIPDNAHSASAPGGYQNSERIIFFPMMGFDPNLNDTFNVDLTLTGVPGAGTMSVSNVVQIGSGLAVPEPTTWAMMILGLGGVGATLRRTRRTSAAATA